jgi:oligoribonuclease
MRAERGFIIDHVAKESSMMLEDGLVWVDLEMTGLDPDRDVVIEIATIVTDAHLNVIAEGPVLAIHHSDTVLATMDEWNTRQHGQSGLTQRVRESRLDAEAVQDLTLEFLRRHVPPGKSPMCGNSICQDRRFMARRMPRLEAFFHYRNLDVSTVKELARRWRPDVLATVTKQGSHLALDDIRDSIAELRHYREHFFRMTP